MHNFKEKDGSGPDHDCGIIALNQLEVAKGTTYATTVMLYKAILMPW